LEAEKKLNAMRSNCGAMEEKIAITLYLQQLKTLRDYVDKNYGSRGKEDRCLGENYNFFVPVVHNVSGFAYPLPPDGTGGFIRDRNGEIIPVVVTGGEEEYIKGLLAIMNKRYDDARKFFAQAKEEGYAVDEIDNVLTTLVASGDRYE
jgi:hypothetical protein